MNDSQSTLTETLLRQEAFLRGLAKGLLRDEHAADDVVQDTWVKVLEKSPSGLANPTAWLARVTRNAALSKRRSKGRRELREAQAARPEATVGFEREGALRSVTDAVLALDEPYRSVILARYFEGLDARQIASREGTPLATVRSRLQRAHELLRNRLDREHGDRRTWALGLAALLGESDFAPAPSGGPEAALAKGGVSGPILIASAVAATAVLAVWGLFAFGAGGEAGVLQEPGGELVSDAGAVAQPEAELQAASAVERGGRSRVEAPARAQGRVLGSVFYADGEPASGIAVKVVPWGEGHPFLTDYHVHTDEHGRFTTRDMGPGMVSFYVDRTGYGTVELEPGAEASIELEVHEGFDVEGVVLDLAGHPVEHAAIWLSDPGNGTKGVEVTKSDAAGRFRLRSVSDQNHLGARKAGFAPSALLSLDGHPDASLEVTLVLQGAGAALDVLVLGPGGKPVEGAKVELTSNGGGYEGMQGQSIYSRTIPDELVTDAQGRASAESLAPGTISMEIGSVDFAGSKREVVLREGQRMPLTIQLEAGAALAGVVRSSEGDPLEGITVLVGRYGDLATRETLTGPDGRYRLHGIPTQTATAVASKRGVGRDEAEQHFTDGAEILWNPVIDAGRVLRGRLVSEHGEALVGWSVRARVGPNGWEGAGPSFVSQAFTDAEGSFRIVNCPDQPIQVSVTEQRYSRLFPEAHFADLEAGPDVHELIVLDRQLSTSSIAGRVVDRHGEPLALEVVLRREGTTRHGYAWSDPATGAFAFEPLAPGNYELVLEDEEGRRLVQPIELEAEQGLDVGELTAREPGALIVRLSSAVDLPLEEVTVSIQSTEQRRNLHHRWTANAVPESVELAQGNYELLIGGHVLRTRTPFAVEPGQSTTLEIEVRGGPMLYLEFRVPQDLVSLEEVVLTFRDSVGEVAWTHTAYLFQNDLWEVLAVPPAEDYWLEASCEERGWSARVHVGPDDLVERGAYPLAPLVVELR